MMLLKRILGILQLVIVVIRFGRRVSRATKE
jgi:hypothetical protein